MICEASDLVESGASLLFGRRSPLEALPLPNPSALLDGPLFATDYIVIPSANDSFMPRRSRSAGALPILETKATYFRKTLFGGVARLFTDRLEISSIALTGISVHRIPLIQLERVKVDSAIGGRSIYLHMRDGEAVRLELVRGGALWGLKINERLGSVGSHPANPDLRNRRAADRVAREPEAFSDSRPALHDGFSQSGNSVWTGGGGYSPDHSPVQLPSTSED